MEIDVRSCSACGSDHQAMTFEELDAPEEIRGLDFTHVGTCPETGINVYLVRTNFDDNIMVADHVRNK